jgi:hypothetical protein
MLHTLPALESLPKLGLIKNTSYGRCPSSLLLHTQHYLTMEESKWKQKCSFHHGRQPIKPSIHMKCIPMARQPPIPLVNLRGSWPCPSHLFPYDSMNRYTCEKQTNLLYHLTASELSALIISSSSTEAPSLSKRSKLDDRQVK